jgi:hypothetical protein
LTKESAQLSSQQEAVAGVTFWHRAEMEKTHIAFGKRYIEDQSLLSPMINGQETYRLMAYLLRLLLNGHPVKFSELLLHPQ